MKPQNLFVYFVKIVYLSGMKITKEWAMPDSNTFSIKPIRKFISKHLTSPSVDPFANRNRIATITNDIDPEMGCDFNMDALDFLKSIPDKSQRLILFDPPYSPRQIAEVYKKMGRSVNMETTQSSFWKKLKVEISRICTDDGVVLSFGWNSGGIGTKYGFQMIEILLVAHGGSHNDTICTAEIKKPTLF